MNEAVRPRCIELVDLESARQTLARALPVAENDLPWRALEHAHEKLGETPAFSHAVGAALIVSLVSWAASSAIGSSGRVEVFHRK